MVATATVPAAADTVVVVTVVAADMATLVAQTGLPAGGNSTWPHAHDDLAVNDMHEIPFPFTYTHNNGRAVPWSRHDELTTGQRRSDQILFSGIA